MMVIHACVCICLAPKAQYSLQPGAAPQETLNRDIPGAESAIQDRVESRFQRSFVIKPKTPGALPQAVLA